MVIYSIKDDTITLRDESAVVSYSLSPQGGGTSARLVTGHLDPSTSAQTINRPADADGFSSVSIDPVTSAIDPAITPENIVDGVTILGVEGTAYAFPDFSELGYDATESVHAFTAWLDKKSYQYDDAESMLQGIRQDIQASVKYFADQGITKDSDYTFNFVRTGGAVATTFMIKTATPYISGNGNDIAVTSTSDIIYYPMLKVKLPVNSAAMRIMTWLNYGSYYEGFVFEKQDDTPASVHTISWAEGGAYLFNDFNQVFYDCLESGGSYGKSHIFRNVTCFFRKGSVSIPKAEDTSEMFRDCIFAKGFDGSIYLPAATDTHEMFRNCSWQASSRIKSISCPESLNAAFMFTSDSGKVSTAMTIGPVSLPKATNVEQMFRYMEHTHIEGPIDIHSCTDAENFFCWSEPDSCPVPDTSFGPIDQKCFFFYMAQWPTAINNWDTSQIKNATEMFGDAMWNLASIGLMDLSAVETASTNGICGGNGGRFDELTDVAGFTGLKLSINFSSASKLTAESVTNIITQAADCSALESKPTLTLHADAYAKVTEETKSLASTKGWTIAQA